MSKWDEQRPTAPYGSPRSARPAGRRGSGAPALPEYVVQDILAYVGQALGRFATPGEVRCSGWELYLEDSGTELNARVSIAAWSGEWPRMDEATRRRRADEVARALSRERMATASLTPPRRIVFVDPKLLFAGAALLVCGLWIAFSENNLPNTTGAGAPSSNSGNPETPSIDPRRGQNTTSAANVGSTGRAVGDARSSRVCGATLNRIFQGGSVSVADVDGFRVQIALLQEGGTQPLETHPALRRFVQDPTAATGSKFIWDEEPGLAPVETSDSVVVTRRIVVGEGEERIFGVTLSFGGSLVDAYFKEEERNRYFHIASALSKALDATHGAVYARCFDRPLHALGSWFRGHDTGAAISSLVYFMGTYARPPHLAKPFAQLPGEQELNRLHAFRSIGEKTKPLTRDDLATLLGNEGGMATGKTGEQVIITFPFGDGNRASRASRGIVRVTGLGY